MANRLSTHARLAVLGVAAILGATLFLPAGAGATPRPNPRKAHLTIGEVHQQLRTLAMKNSQLVDQFDGAQTEVGRKRAQAAAAQRVAHIAARHLAYAHAKLSASAVAMYEGGSFSATGALLNSDSGSSYLDQLDTLSMLSSHNSQMVSDFSAAQRHAKDARAQANDLLASARQKRDALAKQRVHVQDQIDTYKTLLAKLTAAQRAAFLASQSPKVSKAQIMSATQHLGSGSSSGGSTSGGNAGSGGSAAARRAVQFALAQVGKPYVWGAAGPSSYDCSGLTSSAWHAGGVSLPHSAREQFGYGTHVSYSQMVPGDLMFFYSPIGHVSIYIGNGLMVSAPQTGENVKVIPANSYNRDFVGATHLG